MPNIRKVDITAKTIYGVQARTKNADELSPETHKIAPLWGKFFVEVLPTLETVPPLYGVYHSYESDVNGEYDLLVGVEGLSNNADLVPVHIKEGRYLVFTAKGELPQAIKDAWQKVWAYFDDPSIDERRAYDTDFEVYASPTEAEIYIGVHYF